MEPRADAYSAKVGDVLERFAATYGGDAEPVPVEDIADSLYGLLVVEVDGLNCSGMLLPAQKMVMLNAEECRASPRRRRFTIAHELGHLVLHARDGKPAVFCREVHPQDAATPQPIEREANHFAAELLMPESLVRAAVAHDGAVCGRLADRFEVSEPAMGWRLFNLGLSGEAPVDAG